MITRFPKCLFCLLLLFGAAYTVAAQGADQNTPGFPPREEEKPKSLLENLEKVRIDKDKKDHDQMVSRGEEAVKLSADLQRTVEVKGSLSDQDLAKVAQVEKLVKKIREELGGNGDGDDDDPVAGDAEQAPEPVPPTQKGMVDALKARADSMFEQIKQTTRFTISASAIVATNAVLKIARFLKLKH